MAYQTFRVEITRDETRDDGPVGIEITAYIDRMPETNEATVGRLNRAWRGVWNSGLQYTGDFETSRRRLPRSPRPIPRPTVSAATSTPSTTSLRARWRRCCVLERSGCPPPRSTTHLRCCAGPGCGPTRRRLCSIAKMWL